ncbi:mersacidin family lantibiotic [Bacillus sp. CCB-MMP212]|uniref:Type 2 lantibiotic n=1 Tax=Bacillus thuringiensis TaxID=1428 RepID=A0AAW4I0D4_BACTU|nr:MULTISPECIES: mersacidin family lantibiotic [Bacillus]MBD8071708.1 mersacidin family lantibiotic [Bacillus thuringiensis]MBN9901610.1 type 2 lantibiotic [Bacillus thuringiensis]MCI4251492.1 mersacidin family lantibiotic [Bacillus sp. CCB-MMP212]MCM3222708.1 mersacidin family lantibiotic [Bacillus cereus]MDA1974420.1 mersacidin family lantibiotic [Bacillus cereus]
MSNLNENVVGLSMKKLNKTEMEKIYGASGVDTRTHPTVVVASRITVQASKASSKACLSAAGSITGLVSYNKNCLG